MLTTPASITLLAALVAIAVICVIDRIHKAQATFTALIDEPSVFAALTDPHDRTVREWVRIQAEYSADEFELLRRADRMMAGIEAAVIRDWQDMPYDHETGGL